MRVLLCCSLMFAGAFALLAIPVEKGAGCPCRHPDHRSLPVLLTEAMPAHVRLTLVQAKKKPGKADEILCPQAGDYRPSKLHALGKTDSVDPLLAIAINTLDPDTLHQGEDKNATRPDWAFWWDNDPIPEGPAFLHVETEGGMTIGNDVFFNVSDATGVKNCDEEKIAGRKEVKQDRYKTKVEIKITKYNSTVMANQDIVASGTVKVMAPPMPTPVDYKVYGMLVDRNQKPTKVYSGKVTQTTLGQWNVTFQGRPVGKQPLILRMRSFLDYRAKDHKDIVVTK